MKTAREQIVDDFVVELCAAEKCGLALPGGKRHYHAIVREFAGHLYDGERDNLSGERLRFYAMRKTCGFNPLLWIQLASLLLTLFRLWLEWRNRRGD